MTDSVSLSINGDVDPAGDGVDPAQIRRYLDLIYPPGWGWRGAISVSHSLPDGTGMPTARMPRGEAWSLPRAVVDFARSARARSAPGTYLRCSTVRADLAPGKRGGAGDSVELPGLWADLDIAGPGHRHDPAKHGGLILPPDAGSAAGIVTAAGLPAPTAWVHSGGGLYAWWLFSERLELTEEWTWAARARWSEMSAAWQGRLAEGAKRLGFHYGPVGNLDRVMGLVGTLNAKAGTQPRMRIILSDSGPRYAPEELVGLVAGTTEAPGSPLAVAFGSPEASGASSVVPVPRNPEVRTDGTDGPLAASTVRDPGWMSPLDELEARHGWDEILLPLGWEIVKGAPGQYCEWRRPGASHPISATTGREVASGGRDRMWVFSDATGLPTNEPLTKGFVYASLWHGGDMSAAARAVQGAGLRYGTAAQLREQAAQNGSVSGADAGGTRPGSALGSPPGTRRLELTAASTMRMRAARWLWAEDGAHWLPLGGLCLLGGREGRGKSTWTYRLIAQLSRGELPGDLEGTPRSSVIAASEDDWEHTIVPRLIAAGADLARVFRIDVVEPDRRTGVSLPDDLTAFGELLEANPDVVLLVLDPIMSVIPARTDSHKDHEVRRALEPVSALAHGRGITVLGLIHDNKSTGTDLSTRMMGSRAFVAVARAALVCVEEPADAQDDDGRADTAGADPVPEHDGTPERPSDGVEQTFLIGQVKSNLEAKAAWSIRYRIASRVVGRDDEVGKDIRGSFVLRTGRHLMRLEERMRMAEQRGAGRGGEAALAAEDALLDLLAQGELPSVEVKAKLSAAGHSPRTVVRISSPLRDAGRLVIRQEGVRTFWSLPSTTLGADGADGSMAPLARMAQTVEGNGASFTEAEEGRGSAPSAPSAPCANGREVGANVAQTGATHGADRCCSAPGGQHLPWCPRAAAS